MLECLRFYLSLPKAERKQMPPLAQVKRREQRAVIGKDFRQWADDYFAEGSGNLDCQLKQADVLNSYNAEAAYVIKMGQFTRKLKAYCSFAEHIHCLNPTWKTGKKQDGERWVVRDDSGKQTQYYYLQSVKSAEIAKQDPRQPEQAELRF